MDRKEKTHLLVGVGEVGLAIKRILEKNTILFWYDSSPKIPNNFPQSLKKVDVLHITFPQNKAFVSEVKLLIKKFSPELIVIHSTTIPGTTRKLGRNCVHSPVIGQHDSLYRHIKSFKKAIGPNSSDASRLARKYLSKIFRLQFFDNSETTETGKILLLVKFALSIEAARYGKELCNQLSLDYKQASTKFAQIYNESYEKEGLKKFVQPVLEPPIGKIGGTCVIPGVEKAQLVSKSKLLDDILKHSEKN